MSGQYDPELIGAVWSDRYQILEFVGRGGMGNVFKARQLRVDREVALKVIHRRLCRDDTQLKRFEQEARAASKLCHPNNIRLFDYGQSDDGRLFMAMEFLRGETLASLLSREGALAPRRVMHITRQLLKALAEAHQAQVVHRDLKPENIFICDIYGEEDFVKVLDFGIAKAIGYDEERANLTQTGFICGTPRYLSPEQALGQPVDGRADLYAVAVLMFEMLTGAPLFAGDSPISVVMKHVYDEPPPIEGLAAYGALGDGLSRLIKQLLEKDRELRPSSAQEVVARLDQCLVDDVGASGANLIQISGRYGVISQSGQAKASSPGRGVNASSTDAAASFTAGAATALFDRPEPVVRPEITTPNRTVLLEVPNTPPPKATNEVVSRSSGGRPESSGAFQLKRVRRPADRGDAPNVARVAAAESTQSKASDVQDEATLGRGIPAFTEHSEAHSVPGAVHHDTVSVTTTGLKALPTGRRWHLLLSFGAVVVIIASVVIVVSDMGGDEDARPDDILVRQPVVSGAAKVGSESKDPTLNPRLTAPSVNTNVSNDVRESAAAVLSDRALDATASAQEKS